MKKFVTAALALPIPLLILYQALVSDTVEFLAPSLRAPFAAPAANWIVHPQLEIAGFFASEYRSPDVRFSRSFQVDEPPASFPIRVKALGQPSLRLNKQRLAPIRDAADAPRVAPPGQSSAVLPVSWKRARRFELAPYLRSGENLLTVRVSNPKGPPALFIDPGPGASEVLRTNPSWSTSQAGRRADKRAAALAQQGEDILAGGENALRGSAYYGLYALLLAALLSLTAYSLLPLRFKPWLRDGAGASAPRSPRTWEAGAAMLCLLVALCQLTNATRVGSSQGMADGAAHLAYIQLVIESWRAPLPEAGWQMYHPPLFYFVAAAWNELLGRIPLELSTAGPTRVLNVGFGLLTILWAWLLLRRLLPGNARARALGVSLAACLPLGFYLNPNISNEVLAGSVIACALYASSLVLFERRPGASDETQQLAALQPAHPGWRRALPLGLLGGLCLLAKYTGLFVCASITALLLLRWLGGDDAGTRRRTLVFGSTFVAGVVAVAGWLYLRNFLAYGDAFVGNWDPASGFAYEQEPGYRTAGFYARFGSFLWHIPERAIWSGFWEGIYTSLWTDPHRYLFRPGGRGGSALESLLLWLALLPSAGIALGFLRACRQLWSGQWDHPYFILVTTSFWTLASVVSFTLEVPFYSTVSAVFLCSLIPAIAVFAALGLELQCRQLGRLRILLYADLAALYALTLYLFRL